jgi:ATP-dependent 26S proteasome regulatory subunit
MNNGNNYNQTLEEIELLIRSKRTIVNIITSEEQRVLSALNQLCSRADVNWDLLQWDIVNGLHSNFPEFLPIKEKDQQLDQDEVLNWFDKLLVPSDKYAILVLKDYNKFFGSSHHRGQIENRIIRHIKNLSQDLVYQNKTILILSNSYEIPNDIEKSVHLVDWPLPEKIDLQSKIDDLLNKASKRKELAEKFQTKYDEDEMDIIVNSFRGLTLQECEQVTAYCMIKYHKLLPDIISNQKKDIIKKSGLLEWINTETSMQNVGGLDGLKEWLEKRKDAFSNDAIEYGLPSNPKGLMLVGIQGAGKSLFAKAISSFWNFPLIRLDMGKIFSGIVGSSESNMRQVFKVIESVAPCILWCDEIDKGMSGGRSSGFTDGGTTSRVLGSWLTWMQDRSAPVFVVATANDVSNLPPELLRKGRFDEIFFVDLPNIEERKTIFKIHLEKRNRDSNNFDINLLAKESNNFTGAEIESSIEAAMYEAFSDDKREINTKDILLSLKNSVPIAVIMKEEIAALRLWASERARSASKSNKEHSRPYFEEDDL